MIRTRKIVLALALSLAAVSSFAAEPATRTASTGSEKSTLLQKIVALSCGASPKCKY